MNAETNFTQSTRFWAVLIFPTDKMSIDSDTGPKCRHFSQSCPVKVTEIDSGIE